MPVPLVAQIIPTSVVSITLIEQILSILHLSILVLFLLLLLFFALGGRRLRQFDVVFDDFVGKDNTLIRTADPRSLRLDLN